MVAPKQLTLLAAAGVAASLFLAQPARSSPAALQTSFHTLDQARADVVQPVGHRRWQGYRGSLQAYHGPRRRYGNDNPWRRYGYHRTLQGYAGLPYWRRFPGLPYRPWGPYEPCVNCPAFR